jgi:TonB family protein
MNPGQWIAPILGMSLLLSACYTSTINTDAAQRTNAALERLDRGESINSPAADDTERRLWADKPEYAALPELKYVKHMRVISAAAPKYPYLLYVARVAATVRVSFVVGIDGHVEAARIIESSDSRFDASALEAIVQFKFIPAQGAAGPEREMAILPFNFVPKGKATNGPAGPLSNQAK